MHSDEWCFGSLVDYGDGEMEIQGFDVFREGFDEWKEISIDSDTVGQFTGLLDANGKEIYEGDVIESNKNGVPTRHLIAYNHVEAAFIAELIGTHISIGRIRQGWIDQYEKRIVSNIHDDPGLLKGGTK